MEPCKDQATIANLKPLDVNHHNTLLYTSLRQCMANNAELRDELLKAAEMINKLTQMLQEKNES